MACRALENGALYAVLGIGPTHFLSGWVKRSIRGGILFLLVAVSIGGIAWIGHRSLRREARMRFELMEANRQLEQRVARRTRELSLANRELHDALEEKDRANRAKGQFLAAANHDLRQPFQSLRLFHHLLERRLQDPQDRALLGKLGEALDSGETLLHSFLEVATLDAGVIRPELGDFLIDDVLAEVVEDFSDKAAAKGLRLRLCKSGLWVRSDRALIIQILSELVRNSITYTSRGGILLGCRRQGNEVRVEVWDSGSGIPVDQHASIFEDFVQLGNPERNGRNGLGLGLAKVRRKAALLNHPVILRSRPNRGSVFAITLPLAHHSERATDRMAHDGADPESGRTRKILLVEDDACQRTGLILLLEEWGYKVTSAMDGDQALAILDGMRSPPDLILSDFRLPGTLNGVDIVRTIQQDLRRKVPAIIMTGDTAPDIIREAVEAGCRLLHKPYLPGSLKAILQAAEQEMAAERSLQQSAA